MFITKTSDINTNLCLNLVKKQFVKTVMKREIIKDYSYNNEEARN